MAHRPLLSPSPRPETTVAAYALGRLLALPAQAAERAARPAMGGGAPATPIQTLAVTGGRKGRSTPRPIEQWLFKPQTSPVKLPFARLELPLDAASGGPVSPEGLPTWLKLPDLAEGISGADTIDERAVLLVFRDRSALIGRTWRTADAADAESARAPLVVSPFEGRICDPLVAIRLAPVVLQLAASAAAGSCEKRPLKVKGGTMADHHAEIWIGNEPALAGPATGSCSQMTPAATAIMLRLADEIRDRLAGSEALPTPVHPVEALDAPDGKTGEWPSFLTWSSWADADTGILVERLALVGDILTRHEGTNIVPRLRAGFLAEKDGNALRVDAAIDAGSPELDAEAARLFFSGDWTPDRFTGWDVGWIGKCHGRFSFSSIEGRFLPYPKRLYPVRFPKTLSGHACLAAIRALAEQPCPARAVPLSPGSGCFPALRAELA